MQIRRLKINRFRGIEQLLWFPKGGVNCLTGRADSCKSTVLEAISLLLSAAPGRVASEYDYLRGEVDQGFVIEAIVGSLDEELLATWPVAPLWTWMAATKKAQPDPDPSGEDALCIRVRGTPDLEIEHLVIDPSEGELPLSPAKRQLFGLATIGAAAGAFRELRMARGTLLHRNVDSDHLRGLVTEAMQATRDGFKVPAEVRARLQELSTQREGLAPGAGEMSLALLSPRGANLLGMLGLFSTVDEVAIPLANAGLGTQQLTLFALATALIGGTPLFVIDEIESGLEPFRQRDLLARVREAIGSVGQAFVTSHSPAAVGALQIGELHRIEQGDAHHEITPFPESLGAIKRADPEALMCRLPVLTEGSSELGLLERVFEHLLAEKQTTLEALGIRLADGGGQPNVFTALDALRGMRLRCGAFLDSEHGYGGKRAALEADPSVTFATYPGARCLEEALAGGLALDALDELIETPGPGGAELADGRRQQLTGLSGEQSRKTLAELAGELGEQQSRRLFAEAANRFRWFKSSEGGALVGSFLIERHRDCEIVVTLADLLERLRGVLDPVGDQSAGPTEA